MNKEKHWDLYKEKCKDTILLQAKLLFLKNKIEKVKMTEIAENSGIGIASLYRYYGTKEAIAIEVASEAWSDITKKYIPKFYTESFLNKKGIERFEIFLNTFKLILEEDKNFILFISDFDSYCLRHNIPKSNLIQYEKIINTFFEPYKDAISTGYADGTIHKNIDIMLSYKTLSHTLISLITKIAEGEILDGDNLFNGELELMTKIILQYFANN